MMNIEKKLWPGFRFSRQGSNSQLSRFASSSVSQKVRFDKFLAVRTIALYFPNVKIRSTWQVLIFLRKLNLANWVHRILNVRCRGRHELKFGRYPGPKIIFPAGTHRYPTSEIVSVPTTKQYPNSEISSITRSGVGMTGSHQDFKWVPGTGRKKICANSFTLKLSIKKMRHTY